MSETEHAKYRMIHLIEGLHGDLLARINALADVGYRVHTFTNDYALLSLHSNKFEGITNLKDIHPSEVDKYLLQGWEILDTYSKLIRVVKRSTK